MPGQLLKFLHAKDIDRILVDGTIRISTLSYFRGLEGLPWIADPDEASTTVNTAGAVITSEGDEPQFEPWRPAGFSPVAVVTSGAKLIFAENSLSRYQAQEDCFIFCASEGDKAA